MSAEDPQYLAIPKSSNAVVEVALANGTKTLLQVKPVTQDIQVFAWSISLDGASAGAPAFIELIDTDVAATVTSVTPELWAGPNYQAARAAGGSSATGYNAAAEGTIAASRLLDSCEIRPDGGLYTMWLPTQPRVAAGRFLRIRATYTATTVNAIPWILFAED